MGLLCAMGDGDGRAAARHVLSFSDEQTCVGGSAVGAFEDAMVAFFAASCQGYHTGIDLAGVLKGVLGLVREHGVRIDVNYATLVMNALCLDGLANALVPGYNVMDAAAPLLRAHSRWKGLGATAVGQRLLNRVALPLALRRKRRRDRAASRSHAEGSGEGSR